MEKEDDIGLDKACKNKKKTFLKVFLWSTYLDFARQTRGTGQRCAVGNVSGYRCMSDCRFRGREFDPGPVPYFRGD